MDGFDFDISDDFSLTEDVNLLQLPEIPNIPIFEDVNTGRFDELINQKIDLDFGSYDEQKIKEDKMNEILIQNRNLKSEIDRMNKEMQRRDEDLKQQRIQVSYLQNLTQSLVVMLKSSKRQIKDFKKNET